MVRKSEAAVVLPEAAALAEIDTALAVLTAGSASYEALQAARETAVGALALAEAEAARQSERQAEETAVRGLKLPEATIAAMLAAIEARYAPVVPEAATPAPEASTRKGPSDATLARNAAAVAAYDGTAAARCAAADTAFAKDWAGDLHGVSRVAGTRYCSIVALAAGVANAADYRSFVAQLRHYYVSVGLRDGGASAATLPWVLAIGPHARGSAKGEDSLPLKFLSGAALALRTDGTFGLAKPSTAGARFLKSDAAALAAFNGGSVAPQTAPEAASKPASVPTPPAAPTVPATAPAAPSAAPEASLTRTARCQHCGTRNVIGMTECASCGDSEWQAS
jgi:hypothetical protein